MMTLLFSGLTTDRIGRGSFAKGFCVQLLLILAAAVVYGLLSASSETAQPLFVLLLVIFAIPIACMGVVLQVKRIRDWGISGWFFLLAVLVSFIPVVGALVGLVMMVMYFAVPTDAFASVPSRAEAV